jgi:hypothetical protein
MLLLPLLLLGARLPPRTLTASPPSGVQLITDMCICMLLLLLLLLPLLPLLLLLLPLLLLLLLLLLPPGCHRAP